MPEMLTDVCRLHIQRHMTSCMEQFDDHKSITMHDTLTYTIWQIKHHACRLHCLWPTPLYRDVILTCTYMSSAVGMRWVNVCTCSMLLRVCVCTAAPYWLWKPESQDVAENETGTFHCRGEGIPEPTVKWLINGVPVTSELMHSCTQAMYWFWSSYSYHFCKWNS